MALTWTVPILLAAASGLALVLLGLAVAMLRPRRSPAAIFSAFCMAWGAQVFAANLYRAFPPGEGLAIWHLNFALQLPTYFFLVYFVTVYPTRARSRWADALTAAFGLCAALAVLLFVVAPGALLAGPAPLHPYVTGIPFFWAFQVAAAWMWLTLRQAPPALRPQASLLLTGLLLYVSYSTMRLGLFTLGVRGQWEFAPVPVTGALLLMVVAASSFRLPLDRDRRRLLLAAIVVPAVVAGLEATALAATGVPFDTTGLWRLGTAAAVAYAIARLRLFDLDVRLRWTVQQSTIAAFFVALYIAGSQSANALLAPGWGPYVGIAAAGLVALALVPLQKFAERVAHVAVPGSPATPEYLNLRKVEVYQAALEEALADDGSLSSREEALLAKLRERLGITERDHALLLHALGAGRGPGRSVAEALTPGEVVLGKYRLERLLGEGGMGRTYLATDTVLGRPVVLKALRPEHARDAGLLAEARAMGALRHPQVVTLFDVEQVGSEAFLVMEHVPGGSLADRLRRGPLPPAAFRRVALDVLDGLAAVHRAGLLHRDVKPSNVLLTEDGGAKLADFGLVQRAGEEATAGPSGPGAGTVRYMSPEQARGRPLDARTDVFSAAATLYEAWTGRPYLPSRQNETSAELLLRAGSSRSFRGTLPGPPALRSWFARALDPDPAQRFVDGAAMRKALEAIPLASRARKAPV